MYHHPMKQKVKYRKT